MGLFDQFGKQPTQVQQVSPQQAFQNDLARLKANPIEYARSHGKNLPDGITDPNQMAQYLLRSTQVNNPRYQAAMQLIGSLTSK